MRMRALAGTAALALLATASCTAASSDGGAASSEEAEPGFLAVADPEAATGGELVVQVDYDTAEASGLDPQGAAAARAWMIEGLVYETLTTIDENLAVQPGLATSWEQPSETEYVFTLDTEATFSNGRDMTADDVVGSLRRLIDNPTVWTGQLGPVTAVEATGADQVTVTLAEPYEPFLAALANTPAAVLPMAEVAAGEIDLTAEMLGTGPLVATDHRQDEYWVFEPNEHHPAAADLGFSSLRLEIVADEATRVAGLRDGSADVALLNAVDSADLLTDDADVEVVHQQNTDFHYLIVNSLSGDRALQEEDVRFAINAAIDRDGINDLVMAGVSTATGVTPSPLPDACSVDDLPSSGASLEDAKAVIDAHGGLELDLLIYDSEAVLADIAQVIQQNLAEIGVTVQIATLDYATFSSRVYADPADFDLALSWFSGYADPAMVTGWWNPRTAAFSAGYNQGSPELDALIAAGASTPAGSERAGVFTDLCTQADTESETIPLVLRPSIIGYRGDTVSPTFYSNEGYGDVLRMLTEFHVAE